MMLSFGEDGSLHKVDEEKTALVDEDELDMLVNKVNEQSERIQLLEDELNVSAKDYQIHHEVISFADDLIMSHLTKHYQRQWKAFCKKRGVNDD